MKKFREAISIIILIFLIMSHIPTVYGNSLDIKRDIDKKAYNLGYEDGKIEGAKNDIDIPYYRALPRDEEIIYRLEMEYRWDYDEKHREDILDNYIDGFMYGYNSAKKSKEDGNQDDKHKEERLDYAATLGKTLGEVYGYRDFYQGNKNNWSKAIPSNKQLIDMYNLDKEIYEYRHVFLDAFRGNFKVGYNEGYRVANLEPIKTSYEIGIEDGEKIGTILGAADGSKDYFSNESIDYKRNIPSDSTIIRKYSLNKDSNKYKEGFLTGFKRAYEESYNEKFRTMNLDLHSSSYVETVVPSDGGEISSLDNYLFLNIHKGTYYNPITVAIEKMYYNPSKLESRYIKASEVYKVSIYNDSYVVDNDNIVELKFEYYGKDNGGIYKLVDDKWIYMPSIIDENFIKTNINPNSLSKGENIYVVLVDREARSLPDIRGNWAKGEINTFIRRNIVSGYSDNTFKPDKNISRGEFLTVLGRVYGWQIQSIPDISESFKDNKTFGSYKDVISYAINQDYVQGYPDGTFKPNNPITYKEVEIIMQRITNNKNFRWYNTAAKALYHKDYRSKSYNNMKNNITRAEVVYMLYLLNEWKY